MHPFLSMTKLYFLTTQVLTENEVLSARTESNLEKSQFPTGCLSWKWKFQTQIISRLLIVCTFPSFCRRRFSNVPSARQQPEWQRRWLWGRRQPCGRRQRRWRRISRSCDEQVLVQSMRKVLFTPGYTRPAPKVESNDIWTRFLWKMATYTTDLFLFLPCYGREWNVLTSILHIIWNTSKYWKDNVNNFQHIFKYTYFSKELKFPLS